MLNITIYPANSHQGPQQLVSWRGSASNRTSSAATAAPTGSSPNAPGESSTTAQANGDHETGYIPFLSMRMLYVRVCTVHGVRGIDSCRSWSGIMSARAAASDAFSGSAAASRACAVAGVMAIPQLPSWVPQLRLRWLQCSQACNMLRSGSLLSGRCPVKSMSIFEGIAPSGPTQARNGPHAYSLVIVCLSGAVFVLCWRRRRRRASRAVKVRIDAEDGQAGKETHSSANSFHSDLPPMTLRDSYGAQGTPSLAMTSLSSCQPLKDT